MSCKVPRDRSFQKSASYTDVFMEGFAPKIADTSPARPKSARPLLRQASIGHFFAPKKDDHPAHTAPLASSHPSSDDFKPDRETSAALEDMVMMEVSNVPSVVTPSKVRTGPFRITLPPPESVDEDFLTPPTSPLLAKSEDRRSGVPAGPLHSLNDSKDEAYFRQNYDLVRLPEPSIPGKKRSFPDSIKPPGSCKISCDGKDDKVTGVYSVNHMSPVKAQKHRETNGFPVPLANDTNPFAWKQDLGRSYDSTTSATVSMTTASPAWRSPNVSFNADSAMTSFSETTDVSDVTEALTMKQPIKKKNPDRAFRRSLSDGWAIGNSKRDNIMAPPAYAGHHPIEQYLAKHLFDETPFLSSSNPGHQFVSFRQLYEVTRVSIHCKLPMGDFFSCLGRSINDYEDLWSSLGVIVKTRGQTLPERSGLIAWAKAGEGFEGVALSGELKFAEQRGSPTFEFRLRPLKLERSYRFSRKYGSDRFCVISIPGLDAESLPSYLKQESNMARETIIKWLNDANHRFLGRSWRAFFVKPESSTKKTKRRNQASFNEFKYRIFLFAEDGNDFRNENQFGELDSRKPNHPPKTVKSLVDWFMPASENRDELSLKLFTRLSLGLTSTSATIEFKPSEIIRSDDARADCPALRRLDVKRSEEKKTHIKPSTSKAPIMNDGCARISKAAALGIAQRLDLSQAPCVFQGRIGGAKGVWMVDALGETLHQNSRGYWIEITDSQLKFEGPPADNVFPDPARMTFEVHSYARTLEPASLNFQLIPILLNRGVPREVFVRLLEEDLTAKVEDLEVAMNSGLAIRKWNQDSHSISEERARNKGIEMAGGLPDSLSERINWFVEHGFEPKYCSHLKGLLFKSIHGYCIRLEERMNIGIGKSTQALMIADPLAILEENEVHIGFSTLFRDPKSNWADTMIHDEDVLVARLPALLPSDVQKVRAVFKPELRMYRDVIVFSSKGTSSLAEKLSGGDFDGDKAWICWEPSIVTPFSNALVPTPPSLETYGIEKDTMRVRDIVDDPDYTSRFLKHGFDFNLQVNMLGSCTTYHEAFCYKYCIHHPSAIAIAGLLGHLVDRPKGGFIFDEASWRTFLKEKKLPARLKKPAYKDKDRGQPTNHVIDQLVFDVAKGVRCKVLGHFSQHFVDATTWDEALTRVWKRELGEAQGDERMSRVLTNVKVGLKTIVDFWRTNVRVDGDDDEGRPLRKPNAMSFKAIVEKCREDFLDLKPLEEEMQHPVVKKWCQEWKTTNRGGYWSLVKASALFFDNAKSTMVWYTAGAELGEMKVMAGGRGTYRPVIGEIFNAFKLDAKAVDRARRLLENEEAAEEEEDDEFGDLDWGSQWG